MKPFNVSILSGVACFLLAVGSIKLLGPINWYLALSCFIVFAFGLVVSGWGAVYYFPYFRFELPNGDST